MINKAIYHEHHVAYFNAVNPTETIQWEYSTVDEFRAMREYVFDKVSSSKSIPIEKALKNAYSAISLSSILKQEDVNLSDFRHFLRMLADTGWELKQFPQHSADCAKSYTSIRYRGCEITQIPWGDPSPRSVMLLVKSLGLYQSLNGMWVAPVASEGIFI